MAIRAPWKGWQRTAMPTITFCILLNTLIVLILAVVNVAALQLQYDDTPEYVEKNTVSIRVTLLFFWCMIPLFMFFTSIAENWSLWTDRLNPTWAIFSSVLSIGLWALQFALWEPCVASLKQNSTPGYCPYIYQHGGWGQYPSWAFSSPRGAGYAVPTIFILFFAQIYVAGTIYTRQRRQTFRKSDMSQTWIRRLEEGEANDHDRLILHPLDINTTPEAQRRLTLNSDHSDEDITNNVSRHRTLSSTWLQPLEPATVRSPTSRRSTVSSVQDTATISDRSFAPSSLSPSTMTASTSHPPLSPLYGARSHSSSMSRYYTEYSPEAISESEREHATPGSRPSEERSRRRSSTGLRDLVLVKTRESISGRVSWGKGPEGPSESQK